MTHEQEVLVELYSLTQKIDRVSGNDPTNEAATATVRSETLSALARSLPPSTHRKVKWFRGKRPACVMRLWFARNMERFWDSWMDWGSAIFRRNCAALEGRNPTSTKDHSPNMRLSPLIFPVSPAAAMQQPQSSPAAQLCSFIILPRGN